MYQSQINHIPAFCFINGINDVVISPGSRSAPLTMAFVRHKPAFNIHVVVDERSAAFLALGIAQQQRRPVVLICTSGTAVLNFFPAVAEAFFQKIPLLILTADRPPELIGVQDGQTIFQEEVYGRHVKASFHLPDRYAAGDAEPVATMRKALTQCISPGFGPVHVNVPLREPLYEPFDQASYPELSAKERINIAPQQTNVGSFLSLLQGKKKVMLLAGSFPENLSELVGKVAAQNQWVVLGDICSNLHTANSIVHYDLILGAADDVLKKQLQPDLLISFGDNHVSKNLKLFLKQFPATQQVHIAVSATAPDTFGTLSRHIKDHPETIFGMMEEVVMSGSDYLNLWMDTAQKADTLFEQFMETQPFGEFVAIRQIMQQLPGQSVLQLGNSMPVRYASYAGVKPNISTFSNRGTSGIDGSLSTAVGAALCTQKPVVCLLGDLSFLYDDHALWQQKRLPHNLKIVVINNRGGGIFRLIDGPSQLPEVDKVFVTASQRNIEEVARHYRLEYYKAADLPSLQNVWEAFIQLPQTALLEIETDPITDKEVFSLFKKLSLQ